MRDRPPDTPYRFEDPEEAISLLMLSYHSDPIPAYYLSSCLADGFKTAAEHLAGQHGLARLTDNHYFCEMTDVNILIVSHTTQSAHVMNYLDLAVIMLLIQEFHLDFMMPNVEFDIEFPIERGRHANIGHGTITWTRLSRSPYRAPFLDSLRR